MSEISMYKNNLDTKGGQLFTVDQIYSGIQTGVWKTLTDKLRSFEPDTPEYKDVKNKFPAFTFSGIFPEGQRNDASVVSFTGRIAIDIDGLKDNVFDIKSVLEKDPFTEMVCLSAGGRGLVVAVKIDVSRFLKSFNSLEKYYLKKYGLVIDTSCKNVSRLRYVTYDPEIFINKESTQFVIIEDQGLFLPENYQMPAFGENGKEWTIDDEIEKRCVQKIVTAPDGEIHANVLRAGRIAGGYLAGGLATDELRLENAMYNAVVQRSPNPKSEWFERKQIKEAIIHGRSEPCYELKTLKENPRNKFYEGKNKSQKEAVKIVFSEAYQRHFEGHKYTSTDVANVYDMVTVGQFITMDEVQGIFKEVSKDEEKFGYNKKSKIEKFIITINNKWDFQFNTIKNCVFFSEKDKGDYRQVSISDVWLFCQQEGLKVNEKDIKLYFGSSAIKRYDPFKFKMDSFGEWDKKDHIKELCSYLDTSNPKFFEVMLKKHLVRAVRCALGHKENRYVLVLSGQKQNTGKSHFMRWLNPFDNGEYFCENSIGGSEKDVHMMLYNSFFWNMDELTSVRKTDVNRMKKLISTNNLMIRVPYGSDMEEQKRRCTFLGTTNESSFLSDTENTRWLIFDVFGINWEYSKKIKKSDLWSQVYHLFLSGYDCDLSKDEAKSQNEFNKEYDETSVEGELLDKFFLPSTKQDGIFVNTTTVLEMLNNSSSIKNISSRKLGSELKKRCGDRVNGFLPNGNRVKGYYLEFETFNTADGSGMILRPLKL